MEQSTLPPWAAIKTTTFQTTITVASGQESVTLVYPWPARTAPIEYKTVTRAASVIPKQEADEQATYSPQSVTTILPVLVLTNVEAAIVNMAGKTIKRETLTQPPPFYIGTSPVVVPKASPEPTAASFTEECTRGFKCWSKAEQIGTLVAVAIVGSGIIWLIISIVWRCWIPTHIHAGRKDRSDTSEDIERGRVAVVNPTPFAAIVPAGMSSVSKDSGETDGGQRIGALWLWRKRHLLRSSKVLRTTAGVASTESYRGPISMATPRPSITATPPTQHRRKNSRGILVPTISSSIKARDFAYEVGETGNVHIVNSPTAAVPTVDADEKQKAAIRAARVLRKQQASMSIALAAAETERTRQREQENYRTGQRNRRRGEASRSEASENYEKRGDRLRKESPDGIFRGLEEHPGTLGGGTLTAEAEAKAGDQLHNAINFDEARGRSRSLRSEDEEGNGKQRRQRRSRKEHDRYHTQTLPDVFGDGRRLSASFERLPPANYDPRQHARQYDREQNLQTSKTKSARKHDCSQRNGHSASLERRERPPVTTPKRKSKLWTLLPLALQAINTLAEPDGGWEQYQKRGTERHRSKSAERGSPGESRRTRARTQTAARRVRTSDEVNSPRTEKDKDYPEAADNSAFRQDNSRRTSHHRKKEAHYFPSGTHAFENTKPQRLETRDIEQEHGGMTPRKGKATKHSPLKDVSGPPPPMDAPTPSRRLSRKHVRLVDRDANQTGAQGDNITDNFLERGYSRRQNRRNSVQSRDGGDSMTEAEWEEIVCGLSKE